MQSEPLQKMAVATKAMGMMWSSSDSVAPPAKARPDSILLRVSRLLIYPRQALTISWIATVVIKQQNMMMPIVSMRVLPTGYLYTLGRAAMRDVMSMTTEETRSMKASAAVANSDSEPVETAAYN